MDDEKEYYSLTRKVFGILAPFYDIITLPVSGLREGVVDVADPKKGSKILDVATGTGKQAFAFARRGYEVVGVDLTDSMLDVAKKNNRYGNNLKFEVADATRLRFRNGSFDVSCVSFALHDMPSKVREKVVKEMVRVTKPNGTVMVVDYALPKRNAIWRFLVYHFVRLYERLYYAEFVKSDFTALLGKCGIGVEREIPAIFGAVRILKGRKMRRKRLPA